MKPKLNYYLNLDYPIVIEKIEKEDGGGFNASIPQLGGKAFVGTGETPNEAIKNLDEIKKILFTRYWINGIPIPEPQKEKIEDVSGKFLLRMPKELHLFLNSQAKRNETTLNQYCIFLLSWKSCYHSMQEQVKQLNWCFEKVADYLEERLFEIKASKPKFEILKFQEGYSKSA